MAKEKKPVKNRFARSELQKARAEIKELKERVQELEEQLEWSSKELNDLQELMRSWEEEP